MKKQTHTVLELLVNNPTGVMAHITGLFARRCFDLEGIFYRHEEELPTSVIYLIVKKNEKTVQVLKQLEKLYDIVQITERNPNKIALFGSLMSSHSFID